MLRLLTGDSNTQRNERQACLCYGQATIETPRSARFTQLLLERSCLAESLPDCVLKAWTKCAVTIASAKKNAVTDSRIEYVNGRDVKPSTHYVQVRASDIMH